MDQETQNNTQATIDTQRRKLAKAGLITSGVILTLANRSALGATSAVCRAPSGFISGNNSTFPTMQCTGKTPAEWASETNWPAGFLKDSVDIDGNPVKGTLFYKINLTDLGFEHPNIALKTYEGLSIHEVLQSHPTSSAAYAAAALLNCYQTGMSVPNAHGQPTQILSATEVRNMYSCIESNTGYEITASVFWHETEIVTYFKSTMSSHTPGGVFIP